MASMTWVLCDPRGMLWSVDDSEIFVYLKLQSGVKNCMPTGASARCTGTDWESLPLSVSDKITEILVLASRGDPPWYPGSRGGWVQHR